MQFALRAALSFAAGLVAHSVVWLAALWSAEGRPFDGFAWVECVLVPVVVPTAVVALVAAWRRRVWPFVLWPVCLVACAVPTAFFGIIARETGATWALDEPFRAYVLPKLWLVVALGVALGALVRQLQPGNRSDALPERN